MANIRDLKIHRELSVDAVKALLDERKKDLTDKLSLLEPLCSGEDCSDSADWTRDIIRESLSAVEEMQAIIGIPGSDMVSMTSDTVSFLMGRWRCCKLTEENLASHREERSVNRMKREIQNNAATKPEAKAATSWTCPKEPLEQRLVRLYGIALPAGVIIAAFGLGIFCLVVAMKLLCGN